MHSPKKKLAKIQKNQIKNSNISIHWFRKGLRLHDNPSIQHAIQNGNQFIPLFILDPWFLNPEKISANRIGFLLESLKDLDNQMKQNFNSRLIIAKGSPNIVLKALITELKNVSLLTYESDTEPYAIQRDNDIQQFCKENNIQTKTFCSHTLYDPDYLLSQNDYNVPKSYQSFLKLISKIKQPQPIHDLLPLFPELPNLNLKNVEFYNEIPNLNQLNYDQNLHTTYFKGGETEALRIMSEYFKDQKKIAMFEKPKTLPTSIKPDTSSLSPYLKFGCLSSRLFFQKIMEIYKQFKGHSQPPVSLEGQLYWREFFYINGYATKNFDKMKDNKICRQIDWGQTKQHDQFFMDWKNAKTGFPAIDAVMTQLKQQGWIHHLARHLVACFLTRGDLWVSWEKGRDVFDHLLLDSDWSLNNANWMWLSCSSFFYQYFRCYSPVSFFAKSDPKGNYIRNFLPILKNMPDKYIYEPWKAPLNIQQKSKCIIGEDYPFPIVDHQIVSKQNMEKMAQAYKKQ